MNKNKYIVINKTILEEKIIELKKEYNEKAIHNDNQWCSLIAGKILFLEHLLAQSTPLIPEIEKQSINFAKNLLNNTVIKAKSIEDIEEYHPKEYQLLLGELEFYGKERFKDYISNLKLDI